MWPFKLLWLKALVSFLSNQTCYILSFCKRLFTHTHSFLVSLGGRVLAHSQFWQPHGFRALHSHTSVELLLNCPLRVWGNLAEGGKNCVTYLRCPVLWYCCTISGNWINHVDRFQCLTAPKSSTEWLFPLMTEFWVNLSALSHAGHAVTSVPFFPFDWWHLWHHTVQSVKVRTKRCL